MLTAKIGTKTPQVSFLIDKKGIIRHIHSGGQYVKGDRDYAELQTRIEELLSE